MIAIEIRRIGNPLQPGRFVFVPQELFQKRTGVGLAPGVGPAADEQFGKRIGYGTFLIPNVVGASLNAAALSRPAAFMTGELERELTAMVAHYVAAP